MSCYKLENLAVSIVVSEFQDHRINPRSCQWQAGGHVDWRPAFMALQLRSRRHWFWTGRNIWLQYWKFLREAKRPVSHQTSIQIEQTVFEQSWIVLSTIFCKWFWPASSRSCFESARQRHHFLIDGWHRLDGPCQRWNQDPALFCEPCLFCSQNGGAHRIEPGRPQCCPSIWGWGDSWGWVRCSY